MPSGQYSKTFLCHHMTVHAGGRMIVHTGDKTNINVHTGGEPLQCCFGFLYKSSDEVTQYLHGYA